jgi:hypothetical protein
MLRFYASFRIHSTTSIQGLFWNSNFPKYFCIYWGVITSLTFHQKQMLHVNIPYVQFNVFSSIIQTWQASKFELITYIYIIVYNLLNFEFPSKHVALQDSVDNTKLDMSPKISWAMKSMKQKPRPSRIIPDQKKSVKSMIPDGPSKYGACFFLRGFCRYP